MSETENNRPSCDMAEIYKDFAIIHADAERALNLLRGLDEKLKKAIASHSPTPGDGDRYYQFYAIRMNALDCTAALLRSFDSEFGKDILRRAEVVIAQEFESAEEDREANEANYEDEKAINGPGPDFASWDIEIPPVWVSLEPRPRENEMRDLLLRLTKALGRDHLPLNLRTHQDEDFQRARLSEVLTKLAEIAETNQLKQKRKDTVFSQALNKIYRMVIPLLNLRGAVGYEDDPEENNETLIDSAQEILELALKEIREAQIPF